MAARALTLESAQRRVEVYLLSEAGRAAVPGGTDDWTKAQEISGSTGYSVDDMFQLIKDRRAA